MIRTTALSGFVFLLLAGGLSAQNRPSRGGPDRAPAVGTKIPDVSAETPDGKTTVKLNEPKRLTVLVFGSHT